MMALQGEPVPSSAWAHEQYCFKFGWLKTFGHFGRAIQKILSLANSIFILSALSKDYKLHFTAIIPLPIYPIIK